MSFCCVSAVCCPVFSGMCEIGGAALPQSAPPYKPGPDSPPRPDNSVIDGSATENSLSDFLDHQCKLRFNHLSKVICLFLLCLWCCVPRLCSSSMLISTFTSHFLFCIRLSVVNTHFVHKSPRCTLFCLSGFCYLASNYRARCNAQT